MSSYMIHEYVSTLNNFAQAMSFSNNLILRNCLMTYSKVNSSMYIRKDNVMYSLHLSKNITLTIIEFKFYKTSF